MGREWSPILLNDWSKRNNPNHGYPNSNISPEIDQLNFQRNMLSWRSESPADYEIDRLYMLRTGKDLRNRPWTTDSNGKLYDCSNLPTYSQPGGKRTQKEKERALKLPNYKPTKPSTYLSTHQIDKTNIDFKKMFQ